MQVIDANVVIQYLTGDHPDHSPRSMVYLDRLYTGEERALIIEGVIVEIVQVLSSKKIHALPRSEIAHGLQTIIGLRGLTIQNKDVHLAALQRYAVSSLDYVDCLNIAMMQKLGISEIVSFDPDFDRIDGVNRVEP